MLLSVGYITARKEPRFDWFFHSLRGQLKHSDDLEIIIIDFFAQPCDGWTKDDVEERRKKIDAESNGINNFIPLYWGPPKPTVWQGPNRLPKENWWAASNARNSVLCEVRGEWWAQLDDRCVLQPHWMKAVRAAMAGNYAACGPYEKRTGVTVEHGYIKNGGIVTGQDSRWEYVYKNYLPKGMKTPFSCPGEWWYSCSTVLPTEWALRVNGYDETCDSSGGEDSIFGLMLQNNGYPIYYDSRLAIVEDRSDDAMAEPMVRRDKGQSPNDKSHALLAKLRGQRRAQHPWDVRQMRADHQRGGPWPTSIWPAIDWYDGQPVKEMTPT